MKQIMIVWVLAVFGLSCFTATPAFSQNKVKPIDAVGIKHIIENKECPLAIVATAAWCAPCRSELPILNSIHEEYRDKGLLLIAISLDVGGPEDMQRLVDKLGLTFPVYWGGEKMAFDYNIFGVPTILLVKSGTIVERIIGKRPESFLKEKISSFIDSCNSQ